MKNVLILVCSVFSLFAMGQSKYELGMGKAMKQWREGHDQEAIAILRGLSVDKDNWLPEYYTILIETTHGLNNPQLAGTSVLIEKNRKKIAEGLVAGGEEWYVLKGMNETLALLMDPMARGMEQMPIVVRAYEDALALNPDNPRALYSLAAFQLESAKYIPVDKAYYCEILDRSIVAFAKEKQRTSFYPTWGKEWALRAKVLCNDNQ